MATSQSKKMNIASLQVMKTLLALLENNFSMQELIEYLNKKEKEAVFNNNVLSKYINTCRACGVEIPKIQNKYIIAKMPFGLNLSVDDVDLLIQMQKICRESFSQKINNGFNAFIKNINKYSNKTILKVQKETINISYEAFEKAIIEERKIRLTFKNKSSIDCIPLSITTHQKRTYFRIKENNIEKSIAVDKIIGIEILNEMFKTPDYEHNQAVFEVKGALAHRYNLRENEVLLRQDNNAITIENTGEDMNLLLSRLLRYDSLCEVKAPATYRTEIIKIINDTLANYGE